MTSRELPLVISKLHVILQVDRAKKYVPGGMPLETSLFLALVASVNGLLGVEAGATLNRLVSLLATEW